MKVTMIGVMVLISFGTLAFSMALAELMFTLMLISSLIVYAYTIGRYICGQAS